MPIFERENDHGGRKLTGYRSFYDHLGRKRYTWDRVVDDLLERMHDKSPYQQVNMVMLGANDARDGYLPDNFYSCLEYLIEWSVRIPNNHLVICSLIPSPKTARRCDNLFKQVDQEMNRICSRYPESVSFFDVSSLLRDQNGNILRRVYIQEQPFHIWQPDLIHMTEEGVRVVCEGALRFVMLIDGDRIWQPSPALDF